MPKIHKRVGKYNIINEMDENQLNQRTIDNSIELPENYWDVNNTSFPIGTIIPYIPIKGVIELPYGWTICAGQIIRDKDSMINGMTLPNLTLDTFLMGSSDISKVGIINGTNEMQPDGIHSHGLRKLGRGQCGFGNDNPDDQFLTDSSGSHAHGGDKKPKHCGVLYLIRFK